MTKLYTLLLACFLIFSNGLWAQNATLKGTITDKATGETLIGVNVVVNKTTGTTTNESGQYSIDLAPGTYSLAFRYLGYVEEGMLVKLRAGEVKVLDLSMDEETRMLDAVVISAGKFEQKLSDVTVSMEVMKSDFIENNNVTSLEEGLQKIPGLNIMDDQPSIRGGSGYSYGAGSRVLLLVDDIPMLTGASGEARWDFAPIENLQQVEVIKGASSALYGSSALNGIVNFRTAFPGIKPQTYITVYNGMYGDPEREAIKFWGDYAPVFSGIRFMHSRQIGQLDFVFGGNISSDNGYRENEDEARYRFNFNLRYRDKKVEGLSYGMNVNYMERVGDIYLLWLDGDSGVYRANPSYQQNFHNRALNVYPYITYFVNESTRHTLKGRIYRIRNRNNTDQDNFDDMYFGEYQFQKSYKNRQLNWTSGLTSTYNMSQSEIYGSVEHNGSSFGLFTQFDKRYNRLNVSLGGRIEGYSIDQDALEFKPVLRTGINYSIAEKSFLRASFGMGYRYPTVAERYTATSTGSLKVFPNETLQPESGWSSEIAIKQGFHVSGWNGYVDAALFYSRYHNMIEFMFGYHNPDSVHLVGYPPTDPNFFLNWMGFKAQNVRNAEVSGFEFVVTGQGKFLGKPATLLAGYTYTNPIDLDAVPTDSMKSTGDNILKYRYYHSVKLDFELQFKKLSVGMNVEYQSNIINIDKVFEDTLRAPDGQAMYTDPAGTIPAMILPGLYEYRRAHNKGFIVFDARIGWSINENVRVTATAKNLFNKEYMLRPGDVQPPRSFLIQLNIKI